MKKQLNSFRYAISGIVGAFRTEAHLRFHAVAAVFVLIFARLAEFSAERFAILAVLIGMVIALELVNTAVERACDAVTRERDSRIKLAKDAAAGAVLVAAAAAVFVAVVFFFNGETLGRIAAFFQAYPMTLLPLGALALLGVLFIALGGKNKKDNTNTK